MMMDTLKCPICGNPYTWYAYTVQDQTACPDCVARARGGSLVQRVGANPPSTRTVPAVTCTCHTRCGCVEHGPQPREQAVRCRVCLSCMTWTVDGICDGCTRYSLTCPECNGTGRVRRGQPA